MASFVKSHVKNLINTPEERSPKRASISNALWQRWNASQQDAPGDGILETKRMSWSYAPAGASPDLKDDRNSNDGSNKFGSMSRRTLQKAASSTLHRVSDTVRSKAHAIYNEVEELAAKLEHEHHLSDDAPDAQPELHRRGSRARLLTSLKQTGSVAMRTARHPLQNRPIDHVISKEDLMAGDPSTASIEGDTPSIDVAIPDADLVEPGQQSPWSAASRRDAATTNRYGHRHNGTTASTAKSTDLAAAARSSSVYDDGEVVRSSFANSSRPGSGSAPSTNARSVDVPSVNTEANASSDTNAIIRRPRPATHGPVVFFQGQGLQRQRRGSEAPSQRSSKRPVSREHSSHGASTDLHTSREGRADRSSSRTGTAQRSDSLRTGRPRPFSKRPLTASSLDDDGRSNRYDDCVFAPTMGTKAQFDKARASRRRRYELLMQSTLDPTSTDKGTDMVSLEQSDADYDSDSTPAAMKRDSMDGFEQVDLRYAVEAIDRKSGTVLDNSSTLSPTSSDCEAHDATPPAVPAKARHRLQGIDRLLKHRASGDAGYARMERHESTLSLQTTDSCAITTVDLPLPSLSNDKCQHHRTLSMHGSVGQNNDRLASRRRSSEIGSFSNDGSAGRLSRRALSLDGSTTRSFRAGCSDLSLATASTKGSWPALERTSSGLFNKLAATHATSPRGSQLSMVTSDAADALQSNDESSENLRPTFQERYSTAAETPPKLRSSRHRSIMGSEGPGYSTGNRRDYSGHSVDSLVSWLQSHPDADSMAVSDIVRATLQDVRNRPRVDLALATKSVLASVGSDTVSASTPPRRSTSIRCAPLTIIKTASVNADSSEPSMSSAAAFLRTSSAASSLDEPRSSPSGSKELLHTPRGTSRQKSTPSRASTSKNSPATSTSRSAGSVLKAAGRGFNAARLPRIVWPTASKDSSKDSSKKSSKESSEDSTSKDAPASPLSSPTTSRMRIFQSANMGATRTGDVTKGSRPGSRGRSTSPRKPMNVSAAFSDATRRSKHKSSSSDGPTGWSPVRSPRFV